MSENIFSALISAEVSNWRRVGHSASNYFQSIDRSSFGLGNASGQVVNAASNFAGTAGGVGGTMVIAMGEVAVAGVAGAGFLAAVAGPQVAVTAAVVGLVLLVKGTYSNREAAHKALRDYVWNLVDNVPPAKGVRFTKEELAKAADAATTLMEDGKNQIKLIGSKLDAAQKKFAVVNTKMVELSDELVVIKDRRTRATARPDLARTIDARIRVIQAEARALWDKEVKSGGAIFNYVRRCSHTGNYLQAPHLIAMAMKETYAPGAVTSHDQPDFFLGSSMVIKSRDAFTALNGRYQMLMA